MNLKRSPNQHIPVHNFDNQCIQREIFYYLIPANFYLKRAAVLMLLYNDVDWRACCGYITTASEVEHLCETFLKLINITNNALIPCVQDLVHPYVIQE